MPSPRSPWVSPSGLLPALAEPDHTRRTAGPMWLSGVMGRRGWLRLLLCTRPEPTSGALQAVPTGCLTCCPTAGWSTGTPSPVALRLSPRRRSTFDLARVPGALLTSMWCQRGWVPVCPLMDGHYAPPPPPPRPGNFWALRASMTQWAGITLTINIGSQGTGWPAPCTLWGSGWLVLSTLS